MALHHNNTDAESAGSEFINEALKMLLHVNGSGGTGDGNKDGDDSASAAASDEETLKALLEPAPGLNILSFPYQDRILFVASLVKFGRIEHLKTQLHTAVTTKKGFQIDLRSGCFCIYMNPKRKLVYSLLFLAFAANNYPQVRVWLDALFQ